MNILSIFGLNRQESHVNIQIEPKQREIEIPRRIRDLPDDDPEKLRYLRGWNSEESRRPRRFIELRRRRYKPQGWSLSALFEAKETWTLIVTSVVVLSLALFYFHNVTETRKEIVLVLKERGYEGKDPQAEKLLDRSLHTVSLFEIQNILDEANRLPVKPEVLFTFYRHNAYSDEVESVPVVRPRSVLDDHKTQGVPAWLSGDLN
ncbi:hypothetical protein ACQZV8_15150 [Magnetococcales bacterium HHB-1]